MSSTTLPSFGELIQSLRLSEEEAEYFTPHTPQDTRSPSSHTSPSHHTSTLPRMGRITRYQPYKACSPTSDSRQSLSVDQGNDDDDDITYIGTNKRRTHLINGDMNPRPKLNPLLIAPAPAISSYLRRHSPTSSSSPSSPTESAPSASMSPMMSHGPVALPTLPNFNLMPSTYPSLSSSKKQLASLSRPIPHPSLVATSKAAASKAKAAPQSRDRPLSTSRPLQLSQGSPTRRPPPASLSPVAKLKTLAPRPPPGHHHRGSGSSGGSMASMSSVMSRFTVSSDEDTYKPWRSSKETAPRAMQGPKPTWNASGYQYPAPR